MTLEFPVLNTEDDFHLRDAFSPAYVLVSAALVEPIWHLLAQLSEHSQAGDVARALELVLIGFDERDYDILGNGTEQLLQSLATLGERSAKLGRRSNEEVECRARSLRLSSPTACRASSVM